MHTASMIHGWHSVSVPFTLTHTHPSSPVPSMSYPCPGLDGFWYDAVYVVHRNLTQPTTVSWHDFSVFLVNFNFLFYCNIWVIGVHLSSYWFSQKIILNYTHTCSGWKSEPIKRKQNVSPRISKQTVLSIKYSDRRVLTYCVPLFLTTGYPT